MSTPVSPITSVAQERQAPIVAWLQALPDQTGREMSNDSRKVLPGDIFVAVPGLQSDGREYIARAIAQGAGAVLYESKGAESFLAHLRSPEGHDLTKKTPMLGVEGLADQLGDIAAAYYGHPSSKLKVIAITGTNGKTTCANWIAQGFESMALGKAAVVGTLGAYVIGEVEQAVQTGLTTPDALQLQTILSRFVRQGVKFVCMEASSIGLVQGRMQGLQIDTALFTNFSQDHLDYHRDMQDYLQAKLRLFAWPGLQNAVLNADDEKMPAFRDRLAKSVRKFGYSIHDNNYRAPDWHWVYASPMAPLREGMSFYVNHLKHRVTLKVPMMGRFNVSNLMAVMSVWMIYGATYEQAMQTAAQLKTVPGRLQLINQKDKPLVVIDYAHTPDAISQVLDSMRPSALLRGGRLWAIFGAGGNRDDSKRPQMSNLAEQLADKLVLTSDNPRHEEPFKILSDLRAGLIKEPWLTEPDRRAAIMHTIAAAHARDVIVIAGKGHESYQEIKGVRHPFSDLQVAQEALAARATPTAEGAA